MRFKKIGEKYRYQFYFLFRVLVGLMFAIHGAQKLFGAFGGSKVDLISLMGLAGIIEFFGGLMILLGLWVSFVAFIGALEMLVAYFMVHSGRGINPLSNGGESALLYFSAFLVLLAFGVGKWGFDKMKK
jgi:putative oxidoreductase